MDNAMTAKIVKASLTAMMVAFSLVAFSSLVFY